MRRSLAVILGLLFVLTIPSRGLAQQDKSNQPYFDARKEQMQYVGPGREEPEPADLREVAIGYFGPSDPAHAEGEDIWRAVNLAIEEANAEGGYRGLPLRVIPAWSENPWGTGVSKLVRLVYFDKVWAIIGGIDGPSTHLAEQIVAKARLTLIAPASTDKTVNLAGVPWMFSALPGDQLAAPVVGEALLAHGEPFVILAATNHDSHMFLVELRRFLATKGAGPTFQYEFSSGTRDFSELAGRAAGSRAKSAVVVAAAADSARLIVALRAKGFSGRIYGGPWLGRRGFLQATGPSGDGVLFPLLVKASPGFNRLAEAFGARFGFLPDYAAAQAYDCTRLLIAAIRKAGLNRARIRDAVRELSPWEGVSGTIVWNPLGEDMRGVRLGKVQCGRVQSLSEDVNRPQSISPGNRAAGAVLRPSSCASDGRPIGRKLGH
jgi:branched-chain amino acid transport system substrate-binding protein